MIVLYASAAFFGAILTYLFLRCFCKRLLLVRKLRRVCRAAEAEIYPAHRLWFLGGKRRATCDFYVVSKAQVFAVKLFGIPRRRAVLIFTERGEWRLRSFIVHAAHFSSVSFPIEGKPRVMPRYDFRYRYHAEWEGLAHRSILLVHPVAMDFHYIPDHGTEAVISAGDAVGGMELASLPHLLSTLQRETVAR